MISTMITLVLMPRWSGCANLQINLWGNHVQDSCTDTLVGLLWDVISPRCMPQTRCNCNHVRLGASHPTKYYPAQQQHAGCTYMFRINRPAHQRDAACTRMFSFSQLAPRPRQSALHSNITDVFSQLCVPQTIDATT